MIYLKKVGEKKGDLDGKKDREEDAQSTVVPKKEGCKTPQFMCSDTSISELHEMQLWDGDATRVM